MNIGFFLERLRIDGTVTVTLREAEWLRRSGHNAVILAADGALRSRFDDAGIPFVATPAVDPSAIRNDVEIDATVAIVRAAVERYALDTIVCAASLPIAVALRAVDARTALVYHVLSSDVFAPADASTTAGLRRLASEGRVIAHSAHDARSHADRYGFDARDVGLAHLPIPAPRGDAVTLRRAARAEMGLRDGDLAVMTAVRLDDDHVGYVLPLLAGVETYAARGRNVRSIVIGDGVHGERVRSLAPASATFLGFRKDLPALYPAADVFVGEGSSVLEAAAWGMPCILACAQAIPNLGDLAYAAVGVHTTENQYWEPVFVTPPVRYATALRPFLDDAALRRRAGAAAGAKIEAGYGVEKYMAWFLRVVRGERPPSMLRVETEDAAHLIELLDDEPATLVRADAMLRAIGEGALRARSPVAWAHYLTLEEDAWHRLAAAARRTPRVDATHTRIGVQAVV